MTLNEMLREIVTDYEDLAWVWDGRLYQVADDRYRLNGDPPPINVPEDLTAALLDLDYAGPHEAHRFSNGLEWRPEHPGGVPAAHIAAVIPKLQALDYDALVVITKPDTGIAYPPIDVIMLRPIPDQPVAVVVK